MIKDNLHQARSIHMTQQTSSSPPEPRALAVERGGARIPAVYWAPSGTSGGVVLACHGGSGHKQSSGVLMIAQACMAFGLTVLAIDGPVHGERRDDGNLDPVAARQRFREAWRAGEGRTSLGEDMRAALDALTRLPDYGNVPVGYIGVSMGTAYGIPLLAVEPRIRAAAIGLWSTTFPASDHLAEFATRVSCDVWFTQQWNDEFFDRQGTFELFDAVGSENKRLVVYPGPHRELEGERLADAVAFVAGRLLRG